MKTVILNLPSPPYKDVYREWAGGFGTAQTRPKRKDYGHTSDPFFYSHVPYMFSVLQEAGCELRFLDCQKLKLNRIQVLKEIAKENPELLLSVVNLPSLNGDLRLLDEIKSGLPETKVVVMGTICNSMPQEILLKSNVDVVARSCFPYISNLKDLVDALDGDTELKNVPGVSYVKENHIVNTHWLSEPRFNRIAPPSYCSLDVRGYESFSDLDGEEHPYIPILDSIGCPYPCVYCPYPVGFGRTIVHRAPKEVVDEIEYLHTERGVRGFLFRDQSFTMNAKRVKNTCQEIMKRRLDIAWFCESRVNEVTREILSIMKRAGCKRIHFGVETGDENLLKMGKPGVTLEMINRAFILTKQTKLLTNAHVILGWPDDSYETLKNTHKFLLNLKPDVINLNFLTPYPGTKMYEIAQENSLILTTDWSNYTSHTVVMRTKFLSADELYAIKSKIVRDLSKQKLKKLLFSFNIQKIKKPQVLVGEVKDLTKRILHREIRARMKPLIF